MIRGFLVFLALFCTLAAVRPADAQSGQFAPVLTVNGMPITGYELDQRRLFLQIVRAPGDPEALAREALIEDRLRMHAAKRLGIKLTPEQVMAGMEEFASRANLSAEQFVEAIGQGGVQPETFRDFVTAGLVWREVIRVEFGGSVTISEADIDRAVALTSQRGAGVRVLLSEIIVSAAPGGGAQAEATLRELTETIRSEADFAQAARANSASASRASGGKLGWMPLSNLPAAVRPLIVQLRPGQVTPPVAVPGGLAIFQLRAIEEGGDIAASNVQVDYARFLIAPGDEARIRGEVDTCDDLYPIARGLPADRLVRETRAQTALTGDVAAELSTLDEGEASTRLRQGDAVVFLMLCARTATSAEGTPDLAAPDLAAAGSATEDGAPRLVEGAGFAEGAPRDVVQQDLTNQRLNSLSDGYMAELMANAVITEP